ncbi:MAG: penicillin-binding protein 2 [Candidatus Stahlbacteria bacterium]|nr:penicillin-binding protein 2 [Candidatus Stahlbacteria bacterium]
MDKEVHLGRLGLVIVLCVGLEVFLVMRLAELQIFEYSRYKLRVKDQAQAQVKVIPRRGKIYDCYHRLLATTIGNKRVYSLDNVGGNLLGFIGKDGVGLEGCEYEFDPLLSGKPGWMTLGKTPRGHLYPYPGYSSKKIEPSKDIVLTIDADIQSIVESALLNRITELNAKKGSGVVINPKTGEILAIATVPSGNPNKWREYKGWRNVPVQDEFEPGSTFKIVPLSVVVEDSLVALTDTIEDGSCEIIIKGKKIHDAKRHGALTFAESVWKSSNVAFIKLGNLVGRQKFYNRAVLFGFSMPTGIELPGETRGNLSLPSNWDELRFANLSFGQGVTCNLLQLAFAYQSIANKGELLRPIIIKEIISSDGKLLYESSPKKVRNILSPPKAQEVISLLCGVIEKGSGMLAKVPGIKIAGKTGTANKCVNGVYISSYISSFVCFFPADEPMFLVACTIDEPKGVYLGGEVCGPMMRDIIQKLICLKPYNVKDSTYNACNEFVSAN